MFWPYNVLVLYPWFIECPTNFHHDEDASIRQAFESSQNVKEGPKKVPQSTQRGGKWKRKACATQPTLALAPPTQPPPPRTPS